MERHINSKTSRLVIVSLMIALTLILNRIVPATPVYHLSADFLAIFLVAVLYGPIWAGVAYGVADTIGSILIPFGPYNPGITATLIIIGIIFGLVFYKKDLSGKGLLIRVTIASLLTFAVKLFFTTLCLWPMYGADGTYMAYVIMRIPNCVAIFIAMVVTMPLIYKLLVERVKLKIA